MDQEEVISLFFQIALIVFILIMLFLIIIILIRNKRNVDLAQNKLLKMEYEDQLKQTKIEVQENTLSFIAKDLHDNIGQLLTSARMLLGITERSINTPPDTLLTANSILGDAISQLRSVSRTLDRDWLERFDLYGNLKFEAERLNKNSEKQISIICKIEIQLKPQNQIILFRVLQEFIQNAFKHGDAKSIDICFDTQKENLEITATDDGSGFDLEHTQPGLGISNINHRIELLNGVCKWESEKGTGTKLNISLPIENHFHD